MSAIIPEIDGKKQPVYFRFMGINSFKHIRKTFYIKAESDEYRKMSTFPFPPHFTGIVSHSNCYESRPVGFQSNTWCNPFYDFYKYGNTQLQRVDPDDIILNKD